MQIRKVVFEEMTAELGKMRIVLFGDGFEQRAMPIQVKVGNQTAQPVMQFSEDSLVGFLQQVPEAGDSVSVGYLGEGLITTDFTFQLPSNS